LFLITKYKYKFVVDVWKPIIIFKHWEPPDSGNKFLEKKDIDRNGRRRKRKRKVMYVKSILSHLGNPISSAIDVVNVSPPSPEENRKSSLEINPNNISSRQLFVDEQMMDDWIGADYTMDEIREATGVQDCGEEGHVVKYLVGQSNMHSPTPPPPQLIC
jgi:hypothetical protein